MVREKVIEVINLTKIYQGMGKRVVALDNLNFNVYEGEIVGVIGPNGAGKTTLCLIICGLLSPTKGKVYVFNEDVSKLRWRICKKYIASYFAHVAKIGRSFLRFTVMDYLILNSAINAIPGDLREKAEKCLKAVNLWEFRNERINRLSSGMLRRVMLAELLMWDKPIMILDEPTVFLDPISSKEYWDVLKNLSKSMSITILLASQNMEEVEYLCDRLLFLSKGKIIAETSPEKLKDMVLNFDRILIHAKGDCKLFLNSLRREIENLEILHKELTDSTLKVVIKVPRKSITPMLLFNVASKSGAEITYFSYEKPSLSEAFRILGRKEQ